MARSRLHRLLDSLRPEARRADAPDAPTPFSLNRLARENPELARHYGWDTNPMPAASGPLWLHPGCGERVFDGFVNLDFIPHDERVAAWNLLDLWPEGLTGTVEGLFCEDVLEHFFLGEQVYILCNVNRALKTGAVARTLMPSLARLVDLRADYRPGPDELLHTAFGVDNGGDALNIGMRFSGHRWLHDAQSLGRLAELCGFDVVATTCATSTVARFNGLNLRDENNSLSFANDLRKVRTVSRTVLAAQAVNGASLLEEMDGGAQLFVATSARPTIEYPAAQPFDARAVTCINIRSSNLSSFDEHNLKTLVIDDAHRDRPWYFDETLKSRPCMNIVERRQLDLILRGAATLSRLSFSPAARAGEHFTLGCAEIFTLDQG